MSLKTQSKSWLSGWTLNQPLSRNHVFDIFRGDPSDKALKINTYSFTLKNESLFTADLLLSLLGHDLVYLKQYIANGADHPFLTNRIKLNYYIIKTCICSMFLLIGMQKFLFYMMAITSLQCSNAMNHAT